MSAFSDEESSLLITIFGQPEIQLKFKSQKKSHQLIWKEIAEELAVLSNGKFKRTHQQCKDRLGNLKKKYFSLKREIRSGDTTPSWYFWNDMNSIFGPRPTASHHTLVDTLHDSESSFGDSSNTSTNISITADDSFSGDRQDSSGASSSNVSMGLKRSIATQPLSARRNKIKKCNEGNSDMIALLKQMQEKEDAYLERQETRDSQFLKIMGQLSAAVNKIADSTVSPESDDLPSTSGAGVQYFYYENETE